jgi:UDP-N-acetyl-D-mannosaminuronic acid dehydrogenase
LTPLAEVLDRADLLVVGAPHDCYRGLTFRQPVIDVTGTIKPAVTDQPAAAPAKGRA